MATSPTRGGVSERQEVKSDALPDVLVSAAVSLDGYLDDPRGGRLLLSSEEDFDAVDALRAAADAVLIGAGTARRDDPELLVRAAVRRAARELSGMPPSPIRVVISQSGELPPSLRLFRDGKAPTRLYVPRGVRPLDDGEETHCIEVAALDEFSLMGVLQDLRRSGATRVLIEAGERLSSELLREGLVHEVRLAVAPVLVGYDGAPRWAGRLRLARNRAAGLTPWRVETLGGVAAIHWTRAQNGKPVPSRFLARNDAAWLAEAVQLSRRCRPSERAFSVGAILVSEDNTPIATGYSRELDEHCHAEEAALRKAAMMGADVRGATLYSSMEPCSVRLSGRLPCTDRIAAAGIRRVVYALREPPVFVRCEGHEKLRAAGVETHEIEALAAYAQEVQRHLTA